MKKILTFSISIGLLASFIGQYAFGASSYDSSDRVASGTILTLGGGSSYDFPSGKTFKLGDNFGQDLYLRVRDKVKSKGSDLAVARTLAARPLSAEELKILVPGASLYEFLQKIPNEQISPDTPITRQQQLINDLAEEKELADMQVQSEMDVEPFEIFSNGDTSDSGIDLIADLDLIETILFGKPETSFSNSGPGAPPGANVIGGGGGGQNAGGIGGGEASGRGTKKQTDDKKEGNNKNEGQDGDKTPGKTDTPKVGESGDETEGVICPVNIAFNNAVLEINKDSSINTDDYSSGQDDDPPGKKESPDTDVLGDDKPKDPDGGGNDDDGSGEGDGGGDASDKKGSWERPSICNDVFCLKFEAVYKKASSYKSTDNCIACHFEKINDAFKKTVDKNMAPSKQTGNILEGPKCKRTLLGLNWNFVLIAQPILTPPNDDIVIKGDFIKNINQFFEKYYKNPGRCKDGEAGGACKPDAGNAEVSQREINNAVTGTDQTQLVEEIQKQLAEAQEKARQLPAQTRLEQNAMSQAGQFQVILQEMDQMNNFFQAYINLFNAIAPGPKDNPCQVLLNKGQCT